MPKANNILPVKKVAHILNAVFTHEYHTSSQQEGFLFRSVTHFIGNGLHSNCSVIDSDPSRLRPLTFTLNCRERGSPAHQGGSRADLRPAVQPHVHLTGQQHTGE